MRRLEPTPRDAIDLWSVDLDAPGWPPAEELPVHERERAERILDGRRARRWTAARWALRGILSRHLGTAPAAIVLAAGGGGKPVLAAAEPELHFNLSHSRGAALVAVSPSREVGVDVEWIGSGRPAAFYTAWVRREAIAKCTGAGLWTPAPDRAVAVRPLQAPTGFAAALAVAGERLPRVRRRAFGPAGARPRLSRA